MGGGWRLCWRADPRPCCVIGTRQRYPRSGPPEAGRQSTSRRPAPGNAPRQSIVVHNVRHLHPDDRTVVDGIPVTSVYRTLLDYAEIARPQELRWAFEAYDRLDLLDMRKIDAMIARCSGRRGIKPLRALGSPVL